MSNDSNANTETRQRALEYARACVSERAWADAYEALMRADAALALDCDDLQRAQQCALMLGRIEDFVALSERLHQAYLDVHAPARAARVAFWVCFRLFPLGEIGRASAWLARAQRDVEQQGGDCAERGFLLLPVVARHAEAGDFASAYAIATQALEIGELYADRDLIGFARNMQGRSLVRMGRMDEGLRLMDEAMLAATSGELSAQLTGVIYCSLIAGCYQAFALDRAREWTAALERWWQAQPQIVAFSANCLVHRAQLLQLNGAWQEAIDEAQRATTPQRCVVEPSAAANAHYERGEIHRLRGEHEQAEAAYRDASQLGRDPQPGLALLRLAQGKGEAAAQAIRRVLLAATTPLPRAQFLPAFCEIMLATGALDEARQGCDELDDIAKQFGGEFLQAMASAARGAQHLRENNPQAALAPLRTALLTWQRVPAPYIVARLRVLVGRACKLVGDEDGAEFEFDAARALFTQLGAASDLAKLEATSARAPGPESPAGNLSPRELQVLRLVAAGKTNKLIARELGLSEKTIDRHVSNIFTKVNVPSRAAATAYAYEHGLI